ncbi:MAG: hypothetical protein HKL90_07645 [Elusimicrobia bacterium]|nr:hypothetical protein [Elusimicrobiota bacterium]
MATHVGADGRTEVRARLIRLVALLGRAEGVGWDDQTRVDVRSLCARERRLREALRRHGKKDGALARTLASRGDLEDAGTLDRQRESIENEARLLGALTGLCDGRHVYAVRGVVSRLAEDVQKHLEFHENLQSRGAL